MAEYVGTDVSDVLAKVFEKSQITKVKRLFVAARSTPQFNKVLDTRNTQVFISVFTVGTSNLIVLWIVLCH